jgi:prepilin-type N-terminal cleavage/methylation domain-containing protein
MNKGFSFVELMVVVLVIGIMAAGGYPKMMNFSKEVRLEQEARTVFNDLCLLRQATIAQGDATGSLRFSDFDGNMVGANSTWTAYRLELPRKLTFFDSVGNIATKTVTLVRETFLDEGPADSGNSFARNLLKNSVCASAISDVLTNGATISFDPFGNPYLETFTGIASQFRIDFQYLETYRPEQGTALVYIPLNIDSSIGTWSIIATQGNLYLRNESAP